MSVRDQRGFGMLEALISMVVIMIGVLGMIGLQMMAINNTENARYQSLAAMQASSMTAQMLANVAFWGTAPATVLVNGATVTGIASSATDCNHAACSAAEMAYFDVQSWGRALQGGGAVPGLPSGQGAINCVTSVTPAVCTLTLTWLEKNISITNATGAETGKLASGTSQTYSYSTMVSIQ